MMCQPTSEKPIEQAVPLVPMVQAPSLGVLQTIVDARLEEQKQARNFVPDSTPYTAVSKEAPSSSKIEDRAKELERGIQIIEAIKTKDLELLENLCKQFPSALSYRLPEGDSVWPFVIPSNPNNANLNVQMIGILLRYNAPYKDELCTKINKQFKYWEKNKLDPQVFILNLISQNYLDPLELVRVIIKNPGKKCIPDDEDCSPSISYTLTQISVIRELHKTCNLSYESFLGESPFLRHDAYVLHQLTDLSYKEFKKLVRKLGADPCTTM